MRPCPPSSGCCRPRRPIRATRMPIGLWPRPRPALSGTNPVNGQEVQPGYKGLVASLERGGRRLERGAHGAAELERGSAGSTTAWATLQKGATRLDQGAKRPPRPVSQAPARVRPPLRHGADRLDQGGSRLRPRNRAAELRVLRASSTACTEAPIAPAPCSAAARTWQTAPPGSAISWPARHLPQTARSIGSGTSSGPVQGSRLRCSRPLRGSARRRPSWGTSSRAGQRPKLVVIAQSGPDPPGAGQGPARAGGSRRRSSSERPETGSRSVVRQPRCRTSGRSPHRDCRC